MIDEDGEERGAKPYSLIEGPFTQAGTSEVKEILGDGKAFSFPKPTGLIESLLRFVADKDAIILDFFAGSGTTAHAVHKLNAADGGRRRCILVSNTEATPEQPEKNLCRDVCAVRVRKVIEGYARADGEAVPGLGGDFAYLRSRRVPAGGLLDLDHAAVWTALQLIHRETLLPYAEAPFLVSVENDEALIYVPRFRREDVPALREAVAGRTAAVIYSWQPETLRQHVPDVHVQHEAVGESLARRFRLGD